MKFKKYINSSWVVVDKELKQLTTATDSAASPISIIAPLAEPFDNYRVYGTASGVGDETENLLDMADLINAPPGVLNGADMDAVLTLTLLPNTTYTLLSTGFGSSDASLDSDIYRSVYFNGPNRGNCVFAGRSRSSMSDNDGIIKIGFMKSRTNAQQYINGSAYVCLLEGNHTSTEDDIVPHGYKIPLTNTSGQQSEIYPLYIGDTKLGAEEYLDYESGKVYKKKPNLVSGIIQNASVNSSGKLAHNDALNSAVTPIEQGQTYTMLHARGSGAVSNMICGFFENYPEVGATTYDGSRLVWNAEYRTFTAPITGYLVSSCGLVVTDPVVYAGEYPQLAPTDPPVPFPSVQHYEGESTITVDTTVAPDKLELTYQGWRVAANPEPKIYQNGQWMTEYRRVEYIKSDGNPYIVTDIVGLNAATDYIEAEMSFGALSQLNDGTCLFGCATVDSGHWTAFGVLGDAYNAVANTRNNCFLFYPNYSTGGSGTIKRMSCVTNGDYSSKLLLSLKTPQATIVNTSTSTTYTPTILDPNSDATTLQPIDFTQLAKFCVFAGQYYRGEDDIRYYRCGRETSCYNLNIYRNNTLIHNLIPVERQIDGVLGLYDTITDTFYTNSGTGTFVKGGYI